MLKRLLPYLIAGVSLSASAQDSTTESSVVSASFSNAVTSYHQYTNKQSRLYTGVEYFGYAPSIEGIPYFSNNEWNRGSIFYDDIRFDTVHMMYDLVKDRVIILHYNRFYRLALFSEKVKEFTLMGHHFVRIVQDPGSHAALSTGFYDELYTGTTRVLVKRSMFIEETVKETLERKFVNIKRVYLFKDGQFHIIRSKGALFSYLKDHAREVKQFLRKQKLKFRLDKENTIFRAAAYYDSINH